MIIYEAQGETNGEVVEVKMRTERLHLHDSVPHAVVVVTRNTNTCVYYTDDEGDASGRFISASGGGLDEDRLGAQPKNIHSQTQHFGYEGCTLDTAG
ncbi:unnamed protein product [Euphydryas editha]|uniref:Uncharacterized protein n=1 Tax=Euphydryas editha TaxID=104508 RepID=A0AAU9U478_EUPED|nr:unnamed protein product [Euphydryas editha]